MKRPRSPSKRPTTDEPHDDPSNPYGIPMTASRLELSSLVMLGMLLTLAMASGTQAQTRDRVVNIVMEDQFRNRRETGRLRGDVVVLVYAERKGAEAALELGRRLHVLFHPTAETAPASEWSRQPVAGLPGWPANVRVPDVQVIPVACMPEVPKPLETVARSRMRTDSPHVPVWLDFEGVMEQTFGMVPGEPNVVVLDNVGRTVSVQSGHLDELEFRELAAAVDRIRMQSRPDLRTAAVPAPIRQ
jgi:hypothetical protein